MCSTIQRYFAETRIKTRHLSYEYTVISAHVLILLSKETYIFLIFIYFTHFVAKMLDGNYILRNPRNSTVQNKISLHDFFFKTDIDK